MKVRTYDEIPHVEEGVTGLEIFKTVKLRGSVADTLSELRLEDFQKVEGIRIDGENLILYRGQV